MRRVRAGGNLWAPTVSDREPLLYKRSKERRRLRGRRALPAFRPRSACPDYPPVIASPRPIWHGSGKSRRCAIALYRYPALGTRRLAAEDFRRLRSRGGLETWVRIPPGTIVYKKRDAVPLVEPEALVCTHAADCPQAPVLDVATRPNGYTSGTCWLCGLRALSAACRRCAPVQSY